MYNIFFNTLCIDDIAEYILVPFYSYGRMQELNAYDPS